MKRLMLVLPLVFLVALPVKSELPVTIEGGLDITAIGGETYLSLVGGSVFDVTQAIQVRARLLVLTLSPNTTVSLGTGGELDLLYRFSGRPISPSISPYGVGGFSFFSAENYSSFGLNVGTGIEYLLNDNPIRPYGELQLEMQSYSSEYYGVKSPNTDVGVRIGLGIRFR